MRVLVTGASGFVGRHMVAHLVKRGDEAVAAVRRGSLERAVRSVAIGNIDAATDWAEAVAGMDAVVHLAGRAHVLRDTDPDPEAVYWAVNVDGTVRLAQEAARAGVRRLVFVSTVKVNGEATHDRPFRASDAPRPEDAYARSKYEAEQALRALERETGLEVVVVRPPMVYGPGVKGNFPRLVRWVRSGLPIPLGAVANRRSIVSVYNLTDLLATCLRAPAAAGETFLVSDGEDLSTPELIRRIGRAAGCNARLLPMPRVLLEAVGTMLGRRDEVRRLCESLQVDISASQERLGWRPPLSVDEALERSLQQW